MADFSIALCCEGVKHDMSIPSAVRNEVIMRSLARSVSLSSSISAADSGLAIYALMSDGT